LIYMVKIMRTRSFFSLLLFLLCLPMPISASTVYHEGKAVQVLGTEMGAEVTTTTTGAQQSVTAFSLSSLGTLVQALFAITNPPNTIDGITYTEVYSFGKRVFTDSRYLSFEGGELRVGLAPVQVRVPFVVYPVGPLTLHVDGGVRFHANLSARNMTNISIPIKYSEPGLQLSASALGAGFVEGYAAFFVIRGGVGGQLDLVDARLDVNTRFSLETKETLVTVAAIVHFLKGRIYAFLDAGFFFFGGWKRLIDHNLYKWHGYCFATKNLRCPGST
jgi:hypothetical protein